MLLRTSVRLAASLLLLLSTTQAFATLITYETTNISGNTWRYDYSVTNDSLADPLNELTVYFQLGSYENLRSLGAPAGWDGLIAQPDPLLPDNGFIDFLALGSGIGTGETLSGFSILFDWLALGTPGSQPFDIIEPIAFEFIDSGITTQGANSVPEPSSLGLLALGAAVGLLALRRRKRHGPPLLIAHAAAAS